MSALPNAPTSPGRGRPGSAVTNAVDDAVRPILMDEGYDLVLVDYIVGSRVLRLYVDHIVAVSDVDVEGAAAVAAPGFGVDDCAKVSHLVSDLLDAEGISEQISGNFSLEVSSPGLDRPLVRPSHFVRFVGSQVQIIAHEVLAEAGNSRKFTGELLAAEALPEDNPNSTEGLTAGIKVEVDGREVGIAYAAIERARVVPVF